MEEISKIFSLLIFMILYPEVNIHLLFMNYLAYTSMTIVWTQKSLTTWTKGEVQGMNLFAKAVRGNFLGESMAQHISWGWIFIRPSWSTKYTVIYYTASCIIYLRQIVSFLKVGGKKKTFPKIIRILFLFLWVELGGSIPLTLIAGLIFLIFSQVLHCP